MEDEYDMVEVMRKSNFYPRAASERRNETTHVPEIITCLGQFVVGPPETTREASMKVAEEAAEKLAAEIEQLVAGYTKSMKRAQ